jgi:hypothetical protein
VKPLILDATRLDFRFLRKTVAERAGAIVDKTKGLDKLTEMVNYIADEMAEQFPEDEDE